MNWTSVKYRSAALLVEVQEEEKSASLWPIRSSLYLALWTSSDDHKSQDYFGPGPAFVCVFPLYIQYTPIVTFRGGYILLVAQQSGVLLDSTQTHNGPHLVSTEFCQKKYEGNMKKERKENINTSI
jgi:hypothetical protein